MNLNVEECRAKIESQAGALGRLYAIKHTEEGSLIGICGFTPNNYFEGTDVLVQISSNYQNKGIGAEVLSRLMDIWFGEKTNDVLFASVSPRNRPAIALLEKAGFCFDMEYKDAFRTIHHKYSFRREDPPT